MLAMDGCCDSFGVLDGMPAVWMPMGDGVGCGESVALSDGGGTVGSADDVGVGVGDSVVFLVEALAFMGGLTRVLGAVAL